MKKINKNKNFLKKHPRIFAIALVLIFIISAQAAYSDSASVILNIISLASGEQGVKTTTSEVIVSAIKPTLVLSGTAGITDSLSLVDVPSTVSDTGAVTLDMSHITQTVNGKKQITISNQLTLERNSSDYEESFDTVFQAGTVLRDTDGSWNSNFKIITFKKDPSVEFPSINGQTGIALKVMDVGAGQKLIADKAVKIKLPTYGTRRVAHVDSGNFTEITNVCENNTNPTVASESDCKISDSDDLFVWTKHLTEFIVFRYQIDTPGGQGQEEVVSTTTLSGDCLEIKEFTAEVGLSINKGKKITDNQLVTLFLDGGGEASRMIISNNPDFSGDAEEEYAAEKSWKLSAGEGQKIVYAKFFNEFNQPSKTVEAGIEYQKTIIIKPESERADIDGNGRVDLLDFNQIMVNWGKFETDNPADINMDGSVNNSDLLLIFKYWK